MTSGALTADELRRRLATNVRRLRLDASLTLKQAAGRVGMHWRHWQKIEAGENNATLATIVRVASALNVTPAELLVEPPPGSEEPKNATLAPCLGAPSPPSRSH